jgi:hypothetical protein
MPETPEQLHARASQTLRTPPVDEWDTWPWDDVLPPTPAEIWKDNLDRVVQALAASRGVPSSQHANS